MKKVLFFTILITLSGISVQSYAQNAPTSGVNILLTWKAGTYVPADFDGKIMPTSNSLITASAELIDNGKIVDLSKQNVYWYQNNNFLAGGVGKQTVSFKAPDITGGTFSLMAEIPNYSKGDQLKTIDIPVVRPEIVIESPFPSDKFSASPLKLAAQPYFFNTDSPSRLNFNWTVNGQSPSGAENPQVLNVKFNSMQPQSTLSISLSAQNPNQKYQYEVASKNITLIYSP